MTNRDDEWIVYNRGERSRHFIWDKDNVRLVVSIKYPLFTVSDHRTRVKASDLTSFYTIELKNWEWVTNDADSKV